MNASVYRRIISGEAGWWAAPARGLLGLAAAVYALCIAVRNRRYDRREAGCRLDVPVISVGNLTVGGTGKTPMVIALVELLCSKGRTPAVLARGYAADKHGINDEERVIRSRCPGVLYVSNPDRVAAGRIALERLGADILVLDDGFQHRRLRRDLDMVLVDATCPFGYGYLLPRGLLREPTGALRRADLVVLTRCDQAPPGRIDEIRDAVRKVAGGVPILKCRHDVTRVETMDGAAWGGSLAGRKVAALASIGRPHAFAATLRSLGAIVVRELWFPDHHQYTAAEVNRALARDGAPRYDAVLTTEKDAVKLRGLAGVDFRAIGVVKLAVRFEDDDLRVLIRTLDDVVATHAGLATSVSTPS